MQLCIVVLKNSKSDFERIVLQKCQMELKTYLECFNFRRYNYWETDIYWCVYCYKYFSTKPLAFYGKAHTFSFSLLCYSQLLNLFHVIGLFSTHGKHQKGRAFRGCRERDQWQENGLAATNFFITISIGWYVNISPVIRQ